jgi:hypothetical protein
MTEAQFQAAVIELAELHGWEVQHHWSERHSRAGWPDLTMWRVCPCGTKGRVLVAELKTERGRVSAPQDETMRQLRICGLDVRLWRPSQWPEIVAVLAGQEYTGGA